MRIFIGLSLLIASLVAHAEVASWTPTDEEMRSLPPYCPAKMKYKQGDPEYDNWSQSIGPNFVHIHHYCAALNFYNRAFRARSAADKRFNLSSSLDNFGYMITHVSKDFSLLPEIYVSRGRTLVFAQKETEAIRDFQKAIELNPKYERAYNALSDQWVEAKNKTKALEVVTEGLRQVPASRGLKRRYDELGGKKPYPEPYEAPKAEEPVATPAEKKEGDGLSATEIRAKRSDAPAAKPDAEKDKPAEVVPPPKPANPPGNPWCRFCVDDDSSKRPPPSTPAAETKETP